MVIGIGGPRHEGRVHLGQGIIPEDAEVFGVIVARLALDGQLIVCVHIGGITFISWCWSYHNQLTIEAPCPVQCIPMICIKHIIVTQTHLQITLLNKYCSRHQQISAGIEDYFYLSACAFDGYIAYE